MVGRAGKDGGGAVELFAQHDPDQHVRPDHRAEGQERIGLVTHGGFMSLLLKALGNGLPGHRFCYEYEHDNTAITRIAIAPRDIVVEYVNRIEHLPDELRMPRRLPVV